MATNYIDSDHIYICKTHPQDTVCNKIIIIDDVIVQELRYLRSAGIISIDNSAAFDFSINYLTSYMADNYKYLTIDSINYRINSMLEFKHIFIRFNNYSASSIYDRTEMHDGRLSYDYIIDSLRKGGAHVTVFVLSDDLDNKHIIPLLSTIKDVQIV